MRSRWDGGCECVRQTWCAIEDSWGCELELELELDVRGRLHISQSDGSGWVGCGGAELGRVGARVCVGVLGVVFAFCITIERYLSAMLVPELDGGGAVVVSRSEERTNCTRLRRMPEVNGRWCSGGR